ncbi:hypothetical protein [Leptospira alstonii]|uniref:Uncharacterized protein n=1 Tax=Leptospira alstonii serovar Sichuan str. 79601 TaxID=1218565 RepID=M6CY56_9LEPT|nr:hypothetical protein [Leptospira alstonii]AGS80482.1 hypothetical protein LEP1GSC193_0737 [Leptospira phage vB_LalZ_80412-LE1]EMJ95421.1 hypothetical protein LEP1GSC194_3537 [Leptospira alstonii serovar Sichuan str. 79601]
MLEDEKISIASRSDISIPPKSFALEIHLPGSSKNIFFPIEYVTQIKSHRSLSAGRGGISLSIPLQEEYVIQYGETKPLPLSQIENPESLKFKDIFRVRSLVFLYYDNSSPSTKTIGFKKLNAGKIKSRALEYSPDGKSFVSVQITPMETLLTDTDFFIDYQREEGAPQTRTGESYAGVITSAAKVFLQGQLKDLLKNFWDEFFCKLMNVTRFADHPVLRPTTSQDPNAALSILLPKKAYTEFFVYESQVISSFTIGQYVNFWEILRSYLCEPLYELFVDPLETFEIEGIFGKGISFGEIGSPHLEEYEVGSKESKVVFRPTPFYMFSEDGKYRDLKNFGIDAVYTFLLEDLKNFRIEENEENVVSGVHVIQNTFQQFGTVLSEPKYADKIRSIFGPRLLHVKIPGLIFKEENLKTKNKENYKKELSGIRDMLFRIFCDLEELKITNGSFDLPFIPLRPGMPFQILFNPSKKYPISEEEICKFGYITDVVDEFSPGSAKANTNVSFKWGPSSSNYESNFRS